MRTQIQQTLLNNVRSNSSGDAFAAPADDPRSTYRLGIPDLYRQTLMPTAFLITHPDVGVDASMPVPDWPLNPRGRARMHAMLCRPWIRSVQGVFSSEERKARDGAEILVAGLGLSKYTVVTGLGENDRSATGFLNKEEFEAAVDAFFAQPHASVRGWETAAEGADCSCSRAGLVASARGAGVAMIGHGGTGTLLYCHLAAVPISRQYDQPPTNGGNWFGFDRASRRLLHAGWKLIDET